MRVWTMKELFNLTRAELFALHLEITTELAALSRYARDYEIGLGNLRSIRLVLSRVHVTPS